MCGAFLIGTQLSIKPKLPREEAESFITETFIYLKALIPSEEKEALKMDFIKTSEAYGYESIAEAEEKVLAAKYEEGRDEGIEIGDLNARREMAKFREREFL